MEYEKKIDTLHLEWVPTWEGALKYCPDDLRQDKPLRFWRVRRLKSGKKVTYQLKAGLRSSNHLKQRHMLTVMVKGKKFTLYLSHLTMLCIMGFAITDRHHWVIDHVNNNSADDRPSNLQIISQRENLRRSSLYNKEKKLSPKERLRRKRIRQQWLEEMRPKVIATLGPGATKNDLEFELALLYNEHKFEY